MTAIRTLVGLLALAEFLAGAENTMTERARNAVEKALPVLQGSARTWFQKRPCASCHHQGLGMMTVALAQERGFKIDEEMLAEQVDKVGGSLHPEAYVLADGGINEQIGQSYRLVGLGSASVAGNSRTSVITHMLLGKQDVNGNWNSYSHRPPLEDSPVTATAVTIRALRLFPAPDRAPEVEERIHRARRWLASIRPASTEESSMQVLGLAWAGAAAREIRRAATELMRQQRPDGGWGQISNRGSDAYATGQAVVALTQAAKMTAQDRPISRAIGYLLANQKPDGTWLVETRRTLDGLPYFESGFPYGKHQFISYAATAWATMALMVGATGGVSDVIMGSPRRSGASALEYPEWPPVIRAALFGTPEDLRKVLAQGADANTRWTATGVTPLMCAAYSPEKVRILLEAGAEVKAKTTSGETALMLAAGYSGAIESVRLLLKRDADVNGKSSRIFVGSALRMAAVRGDIEVMSLLLSRGAQVNDLRSGSSAFMAAALQGDGRTAGYLLSQGARIDSRLDLGGFLLTGFTGAILAGSSDTVNLLLARGAPVNEIYPEGWTPLMHAARDPDRGNTKILERLLASGADSSVRTSAGESARTVAEKYGNTNAANLLRSVESRRARSAR
jgi:ankyrin repeat protein